jgi:hypothetical protein
LFNNKHFVSPEVLGHPFSTFGTQCEFYTLRIKTYIYTFIAKGFRELFPGDKVTEASPASAEVRMGGTAPLFPHAYALYDA